MTGSDHGVKANGEGWLLTVALLEATSLPPVMSCLAVMASQEQALFNFRLRNLNGTVSTFHILACCIPNTESIALSDYNL